MTGVLGQTTSIQYSKIVFMNKNENVIGGIKIHVAKIWPWLQSLKMIDPNFPWVAICW